jgi:hypothetical protein
MEKPAEISAASEAARHVAVIRVLGGKSSRSSGDFVDFDCFIVE